MASLRALAVILAAALLGAAPVAAAAPDAVARGAGATFPQPVYARWAALYGAETGEAIAYEGIGSGAGVKAIAAGTVAFGASDAPLDGAALDKAALVQFPILIGGVVPIVDVPGVGPGDLVLDGQALADLFMGRIRHWDDPAVLRLNPHLPMPHLAVTPVRRSDMSGTTAVFASYLARTSKGWDEWLGGAQPALRPIGGTAEGSRGMAEAVAATPGAVGYVGFDYAQTNRLVYADLVNPAGRVVQPTLASIAAAAATADWSSGLTPSLIARSGGASWPIATCTYVLMRRGRHDDAVETALRFFAWAARSGGPAAEDLGFVTLPPVAAERVGRLWRGTADGTPRTIVPEAADAR